MAPTQAALYGELADDLHLSWSEAELPERERTKHVHRLHPYLGKFVPQLVEALLGRYVPVRRPRARPVRRLGDDARAGLESGYDAVGVDVAAFNCLLMRVKTGRYDLFRLETELRDALARAGPVARARPRGYVARVVRAACGGRAPPLPLASSTSTSTRTSFASCSRAPRARRGSTTHFDLEFPRSPQREPYWCHKHRRTCPPVQEAGKFLARYLARHARAAQGVPARPGAGSARRGRPRRRGRRRARRRASTRSSPRRRTRA